MSYHTNQTLYDEVNRTLIEIDMQIKHIKNDIAREYPEEQRDKINVWYWTRNVDGSYVLADLLVARAQCITAMATLQANRARIRNG